MNFKKAFLTLPIIKKMNYGLFYVLDSSLISF